MKKKKKEIFEDDGRTIANMNVEGMPWYTDAKPLYEKPEYLKRSSELENLNKHETFKLIVNSILAALLVGGIFIGAAFLFIVFCVQVWFK